jgi:hypothetical protein
LRHYATRRKVAVSSPDEVDILFQLTQSFQPHYDPGVDSASNRNEYQKSSSGVKGDWRVRLTTSLPSVSRLSRKCDSLTSDKPRPVTEIALPFLVAEVGADSELKKTTLVRGDDH